MLDEIEKANRKVFETLLQVLDDGRMTDGQGHVVDFKNTIIIMTSNMGAEELSAAITPQGELLEEDTMHNKIVALLKRQTSPEFINRIDEIVMFKPLSKESICKIVQLQAKQLENKLKGNGIKLSVSPEAIHLLTEISYDPTMGARPVKRSINEKILNPLSQAILVKQVVKENPIYVDVQDGQLVFINNPLTEEL